MSVDSQYVDAYPIKLVRDDIGRRLGGDGTITYEPIADRGEHIKRLRRKLVEEALEYLTDPSVGELADVLAVARALAEIDLEVPWADVTHAEAKKRSERGGFLRGTVMVCHHARDGRGLLSDDEVHEPQCRPLAQEGTP